jgi:hypothetical protein
MNAALYPEDGPGTPTPIRSLFTIRKRVRPPTQVNACMPAIIEAWNR